MLAPQGENPTRTRAAERRRVDDYASSANGNSAQSRAAVVPNQAGSVGMIEKRFVFALSL